MPRDLGQMIGQDAFEFARGVLMEVCACTAEHAMAVISQVCDNTGRTAEDIVDALVTYPNRARVLSLIQSD